MSRIAFTIPGHAVAWGRAMPITPPGRKFATMVTPEKTRNFQNLVRMAAADAMGDQVPLDEPVAVIARVYTPVPASWSAKKQQRALAGLHRPMGKPDLDNVFKSLADAMNGIVYRDDARICDAYLSKVYSLRPRVEIEVVYGLVVNPVVLDADADRPIAEQSTLAYGHE